MPIQFQATAGARTSKSVSFKEPGDTVSGKVTRHEVVEQTSRFTGELEQTDVITLTLGDQDNDVWIRGSLLDALIAAGPVDVGDAMTITFTKWNHSGQYPTKEWDVQVLRAGAKPVGAAAAEPVVAKPAVNLEDLI